MFVQHHMNLVAVEDVRNAIHYTHTPLEGIEMNREKAGRAGLVGTSAVVDDTPPDTTQARSTPVAAISHTPVNQLSTHTHTEHHYKQCVGVVHG